MQEMMQMLAMNGCKLGRKVLCFEEIDSTNRLAKELAVKGAEYGTVVIADRQTAGRGRLGKTFHSPVGGMYLSVIIRPDFPVSDMMAVTACTAAAVYSALKDHGISSKIKWVNDLFLNDRKICGILCEGGFSQSGDLDYLVIGIGLNLQKDENLPAELQQIVTDIASETGQNLDRNAAASSILRHLERFLGEIHERTFLGIYTANSYTIGKQVIVTHHGAERVGLAVGYTQDCGLIVQFSDGTEDVIRTGTARFTTEQE